MGKSVIQELVTKFGFEADEDKLSKIEGAIGNIKAGLLGLAGSVGGAGLALFEVVERTAKAGDELLKLKQRTGITVEALQGLRYAFKINGVDADELALSIRTLNRAVFEATKNGGEQARAFLSLGIGIRGLRKENPLDTILRVADGFARLKTPSERAATATALFGRAGEKLIPTLMLGSAGIRELMEESAAFGQISEQSAEEASKFEDSMSRLGAVFGGIKTEVGVGFVPLFTEFADKMRRLVVANRDFIKQNLSGFISGLTKYLKGAFSVMIAVVGAMTKIITVFRGAELATQVLLGTISLLSALSILAGIGKLIMAVHSLGTAFIVAQAEAIALPLAIGAAIAVLGLVFEDIISYFRGDESITGLIIQAVDDWAGSFGKLAIVAKTAADSIFSSFFPLLSLFFKSASAVASIMGVSPSGNAEKALISQSASTRAAIAGFDSAEGGGARAFGDVNLEVSFGGLGALDPTVAAQRVQEGTYDALMQAIREADRRFTPVGK